MFAITLKSTSKFEELESIRGIAALLVVIHHMPQWNSTIFEFPILRNGFLMVELFFVLSGFVIYTAYADKIRNKRDLFRFQFLRFGRLYPVHLLFLLLFLALEFLKLFAAKYYHISSPNSKPFDLNSFQAFTAHLFLVQAIGVLDYVGSFNSPSWSISTEFYTYLLFGFVILKLYRWRVLSFAILAIGFYLLIQLPDFSRFGYFFTCIIGFSLGCLVAAGVASTKKVVLPAFTPIIPVVLLILILCKYPTGKLYPLIFILSALFIFSLIKSKEGMVKKIFRFSIFKWLGSISYSLYMSHFIILWVVNQFMRVVLKYPEVVIDGGSFPQLNLKESILAYCISVALSLLVGWITYRVVEKPFREWSRIFVEQRFSSK